jgi:galactose-1-phosphate uridylyltransferase
MKLRTCVSPSGHFIYGIHKPAFYADNFRENDFIEALGQFSNGRLIENHSNFPSGIVEELDADTIFEIPNPFAFRGTTYISKNWADEKAKNPKRIFLPSSSNVSFYGFIDKWFRHNPELLKNRELLFASFPEAILLAIASTGTDPDDLVALAKLSCEFLFDSDNKTPKGLIYKNSKNGQLKPIIKNEALYETLANNYYLPDSYKKVMVLRPGVQGNSEIIGESTDDHSHVFEYLRRNSYIPWGHYAANMAHDAIRYSLYDLTIEDMAGMRHLYYQRTYARLARESGIPISASRKRIGTEQLESLRLSILEKLSTNTTPDPLIFNCTLWGWNYGFDFSPSKYRLHASHQQIHQQFALIPATVQSQNSECPIRPFACGDMIGEFIENFRKETGKQFFDCYIQAIRNNRRMDSDQGEASLVIYENNHVMVFVPKAQTSQWEIQLICLGPVGNILEADTQMRDSLDRAMLITMKILANMGAKMVTTIEYAKRFDSPDPDQRLIYVFLPKLPHSPGAFSEAQLRWINGHYPEDFALACRKKLEDHG